MTAVLIAPDYTAMAMGFNEQIGDFFYLNTTQWELKNPQEGNQRRLPAVCCVPERNVQAALMTLTAQWPGINFGVYRVNEVAMRPAGEMVTKTVNEKGILPK